MTTDPSEPVSIDHRFQTWGFIFLFGFMIPTIAVQSLISPDRSGTFLVLLAVPTAPLAWWLLFEARFRIAVSTRGISARTARAGLRELRWEEVRAVRYSPRTRIIEIVGPAGAGSIRVSLLREKVEVLARLLSNHVPAAAFEGPARPLFRLPDRPGPPDGRT